MAVKISELPAAGSAAGTDQLEANQSGTSRRLTVAQVATHVRSTATDTVVVAAGSASAPSIAPTGDSNTGIFFPAADTIAFSEGGVEALRLDSSGNATFAGTVAMASSFLRNRIINGDMRIDQRNAGASVNTSSATSGAFQLDRWKTFVAGSMVVAVQQSSIAPTGFTNSTAYTVSTADASIAAGDLYVIEQPIEGFNCYDLNFGASPASTVTLSFWVRSSITGTYCGALGNSAENRSYVFAFSVNSANTWEQKTIAIPGDTAGTWLTNNGIGIRVRVTLGAGSNFQGTANAWSGANLFATASQTQWVSTNGATFYLTGVQLEVGSAATPFERRQFGQELALCQRYYVRDNGEIRSAIRHTSSIDRIAHWFFPVQMRATPTISLATVGDTPSSSGSVSETSFGTDLFATFSNSTSICGFINRVAAAEL